MTEIIMQLEAKAMIPILEVMKYYFDTKYPCTDESNDASSMSDEDIVKYATYDHLLNSFNKAKRVYIDEYNDAKEKVAKNG